MSDTIVLYENGKAVGGEGHPTNADEITFDNTGTDLVSEEVESAIKEVNAKFDNGSVSVTADGSKTYGTLLTELYNLIDFNKVTEQSFLKIGNAVYRCLAGKTMYNFVNATTTSVNAVVIDIASPHIYDVTITASAFTGTDGISSVPRSSTLFKLVY